MITLQSEVNRELLPAEVDENFRDISVRTGAGWKDLTSALVVHGSDSQPVLAPFGPSGLRKEQRFNVGDYAFVFPFHVNHDIKIGGKAYCHVHWSTDGIDTNSVKWEFQISRALGHDQAYFGGEVSYYIEQSPNVAASGAWRHYVAEVSDEDALILTEPDEVILVTIRRVSNDAVENTDGVFGLVVDFHYEADRDSTPGKAPEFYTP